MKKINSISELQVEKKRMRLHQQALEKKIHAQWNELKSGLKPASIAKESLRNVITRTAINSAGKKTMVKALVSLGATLLVKRMMAKKWGRMSGKNNIHP